MRAFMAVGLIIIKYVDAVTFEEYRAVHDITKPLDIVGGGLALAVEGFQALILSYDVSSKSVLNHPSVSLP